MHPQTIPGERLPLAGSLWSATANDVPARPRVEGEIETDCVVVGAGFAGLSAALHVAESGRRVSVLEAYTPGWGASGRNGGQVNPGLKLDPVAAEAVLGKSVGPRAVAASGAGADLVFGLIRKHGIRCDAVQGGWVRAARSRRNLARLQNSARQWRDRQQAVDDLDGTALEALLGTGAYVGGVIDRRGGNLHPLNYALGLAVAAESAGAVIHGDSSVIDVRAASDEVVVATERGLVRAKKALICTNAYTRGLLDPLGRAVVPVTSVQVATDPVSDTLAKRILPEGHSPSDTRRLLVYFRKDADGRFIMGGRGALSDRHVRQRQQALRDEAVALFPQLGRVRWRYAWGGDVAMTRNHLPLLHRVAPTVMVGIGFNGRGVAMATVLGRILADWASGCPAQDLDFPVNTPTPIPFHRYRRLGLGATVAVFRALDRFKL
ncbi:MAG: FAD-binding oxidoreductase [Pseudomonadota bacterium]